MKNDAGSNEGVEAGNRAGSQEGAPGLPMSTNLKRFLYIA